MAIGEAMAARWAVWTSPASAAEWDTIYAEQLPRVYNFFRYRVGDGPVAEDLTSATFEKAWRSRGRYRRDLAGFGTWLFVIARRVAIDHYRTARRHAPLEAAAAVPGGPTPEEIAERRSDAERLAGLLGRLSEEDRELIALKYGAGLTNRAIARLTGIGESNVGTRLHRRIQELRARWDGKEPHDG